MSRHRLDPLGPRNRSSGLVPTPLGRSHVPQHHRQSQRLVRAVAVMTGTIAAVLAGSARAFGR